MKEKTNKTLHEKLLYIQQTLKAPKGQMNKFGGYKYRSCEDIFEAVKPLLKEQGLTLQTPDELVQVGERYYVKATAILSDGNETITNTAYAREEETKKGMDGSQITGASSSYARKYALNGLFLIDDVKDSDSTNTNSKEDEERTQLFVDITNEMNFKKVTPDEMYEQFKKKRQDMTIEELKQVVKWLEEKK